MDAWQDIKIDKKKSTISNGRERQNNPAVKLRRDLIERVKVAYGSDEGKFDIPFIRVSKCSICS
uniref:Uncharacterized protein n=1 Tax=Octopus bimaculoides TaxID=37653 RepID=A0A0L8GF67_OCTBM